MMQDTLAAYAYDQEDGITWLEDPSAFRQLREALVLCRFRARQPHAAQGAQLVAYATLRHDARPERTHRFLRRVWYAIPHEEADALPAEAVEPRSIRAGEPSLRAVASFLPLIAGGDSVAITDSPVPDPAQTEPEAPGLAFRVKRISVPREPQAAATALRRHFSVEELHQLAAALTSEASLTERQSA